MGARLSVTVVRWPGPRDFLRRAEEWLTTHEDRNNVALGLAYRYETSTDVPADALFGTVELDGDVVGCVVRTPPHKLLVTDMPGEAAVAVAELAASLYDSLPAILGPAPIAEAIASAWVDERGGGWVPGMEQRIYRLDHVIPPDPVPGRLRRATREDTDLAIEWGHGFARDAGQQFDTPRPTIERWIRSASLFIWDDGGPKSIAVRQGITARGVRVGYVYTPPRWRGRGYASACVAAVSQAALDDGKEFCVLYTDLSNPTSNAIYQRIGYEPIADVRDVHVVPEDGGSA